MWIAVVMGVIVVIVVLGVGFIMLKYQAWERRKEKVRSNEES